MLENLQTWSETFSTLAWGYHLLLLLIGGGIFLLIYSRFQPFLFILHGIDVLRGKYNEEDSDGDISPFAALASAIAGTVGMGNIAGVAVAISVGGPGAIFWMWVAAFVGMATEFFGGTLALMYRGKDTLGNVQGGTMYMITEGLGKKWRPLAVFFAAAGMIGLLPVFQANQLTQIFREVVLIPMELTSADDHFWTDFITGISLVAIVSLVIFGGIKRIADVATKLVPAMVILYVGSVLYILAINYMRIPDIFMLIFTDAFEANYVKNTADDFFGGVLGFLIITGVKRGSFSNEAGLGTTTLAHGAAKTSEPVRQGLVAMFAPFIDTIMVCSMTAFALLATDTWQNTQDVGVTITLATFKQSMGIFGTIVLVISAVIFAVTTLLTYSYYGTKCWSFLAGAERQHYYNYFYVGSIIMAAVVSLKTVINIIDGAFALMALPHMFVILYLAPKAQQAAKTYFAKVRAERQK